MQVQTWQWHLRHAIRRVDELSAALGIELPEVRSDFPLLVPRPYLQRIRRHDPDDPLLRQILPCQEENSSQPGYVPDPLLEHSSSGPRGLLQKYRGRVLLVATGACAINCRYCFRRHFPYEEEQPDAAGWQTIIDYIRDDPSISEAILSGGDPLVMNDRHLAGLVGALDALPHVSTIRFHTRLPIVIPQRICKELLDWASGISGNLVFVTHVNHANEMDDEVSEALAKLKDAGVTLLNQSVLLRGVNDSAESLVSLSRRLFDSGVLPYYLHLLDPVAGAAHFDVPEESAHQLMRAMTNALPGYLVPKLVREVPGTEAKQLIHGNHILV